MSEKDEVLKTMETELKRLKSYFPYRIIWGAIHPDTLEFITSASSTKRQANDYIRKGYEVYILK